MDTRESENVMPIKIEPTDLDEVCGTVSYTIDCWTRGQIFVILGMRAALVFEKIGPVERAEPPLLVNT